ncbi:netrin-G1-like isoform X2 [Lethenteron reissneri]|uniref:netrin-G1-like isoform X2 n=1 Tax=Lethenteron reissneri TaxID=7753 RepID=UPI002AB73FC2|nr:netrin-G1-like isoform X2 [Lethenteron reissneri]
MRRHQRTPPMNARVRRRPQEFLLLPTRGSPQMTARRGVRVPVRVAVAWPTLPLLPLLLLLLGLCLCGPRRALAQYDVCKSTVSWDSKLLAPAWEYSACQPPTADLGRFVRVSLEPPDITCGDPPERFCTLENPYMCNSECDAATPDLAHPPSLMFDLEGRSPSTYWQSASWRRRFPEPLQANLTLSWNKSVELTEDVVVTFASARPEVMVLEKSLDYGRTWQPYQYYADDCVDAFGMEAQNSRELPRSAAQRVICTEEYSRAYVWEDAKTVRFEVTDRYALYAGADMQNLASLYGRLDTNRGLRDFFTLTDLRLRLLRPATGGVAVDAANLSKYFYAVANIYVRGRCKCNLHANTCLFNDGRLACDCEHNTMGTDCSRCKKGFRGGAWRPGSYLPYPSGTANPCTASVSSPAMAPKADRVSAIQPDPAPAPPPPPPPAAAQPAPPAPAPKPKPPPAAPKADTPRPPSILAEEMYDDNPECQCYGHSNRCSFIELLSAVTCVSCKHNTRGQRCQYCRPGHYRNASLPLSDENVCIACECNPFGSASDRCNGTGQCECKEGASGLKCGECLAGYYWNRGCQQNACDEELLRCQNGGECRDRQRCACAPGYSGALCEERSSSCRGGGAAGCGSGTTPRPDPRGLLLTLLLATLLLVVVRPLETTQELGLSPAV